ncbi:lytic transglycosylase domain-containing protein [Candidatus Vampirococcus lugosii]|uniref:Transglycosylase n=1 Tax=Candidatus Vampirococcus lugosii TaxID=2789015 RepID=A0ABS5QKF3_9BACT|nr:lytic transglycosylase domain-containing protein [Candidatus Vampirococcus lugosii]MBS8121715.1 putative transglycosylase [Candidatus Vampirococcus lugosii]
MINNIDNRDINTQEDPEKVGQPQLDNFEKNQDIEKVVSELKEEFRNLAESLDTGDEGESINFYVDRMNSYLNENYNGIKIVIDEDGNLEVKNHEADELLKKLDDELQSLYLDIEESIDSGNDLLDDQEFAGKSSGELLQMSNQNNSLLYNNIIKESEDGSLNVDFRGNEGAEDNIGLSDILAEDVKSVKITSSDGQVSEGNRVGLKGGFYDAGGNYLAIFSGDKVEITEKYEEQELEKLKEANSEAINSFMERDEIKEMYTENGEVIEGKKEAIGLAVSMAESYDLDPNLLLSIGLNEGIFEGNMGIMNGDLQTLDGQLVMLCRNVQSSFVKGTSQSNENGDGIINTDDILYGINNAGLRGFGGSNYDFLGKIVESYWTLSGKEFTNNDLKGVIDKYKNSNINFSSINPENLTMGNLDINLPNFESLLTTQGGRDYMMYKDSIEQMCDKLKIPPEVLLQLFIKEGSRGNPHASPGTSSAVGLGQIIDGTWEGITKSGGTASKYGIDGIKFDRYDAGHQIIGSAVYLREMYDKFGSWGKAMVHYHTGPGQMTDSYAQKCAKWNPAIERGISGPITAQSYYNSAMKYYTNVV